MMEKFWLTKSMSDMTSGEWESLCDGCARCCLHKLEDVNSDKVVYTAVVCRFLDGERCQCTEYERRSELMPGCVKLTPVSVLDYKWLPVTCGYRRVAEGKDLEWWHPLVSGTRETVHQAGISVKGKCVSEQYVHPDSVEEQIIHWIEH